MKKIHFAVLVSGLMLSVVAANASSLGTMYIDTSDGNLYAGDPDAPSPTYALVGNTGIANGLTDIGFANGILYGLDGSGNLYSINTSNAAATLIGNTGITDNSLVGLSDSTSALLLAGGNGQTYNINTGTGTATPLGSGGSAIPATLGEGQYGYQTAGDLDFDGNGNLYLTSSTPNADTLFGISPVDGSPTFVGTLPYSNVFGMSYDSVSGIIWGYTAGGFQFDVNTSNATESGQENFLLSGGNDALILGSAFIANPEPSTWVLIGSALILFGASRRYKASRVS